MENYYTTQLDLKIWKPLTFQKKKKKLLYVLTNEMSKQKS